MKLSTRIALAVGVAVVLLVLGAGWLLVRLVAADLHAQQDAHLRDRATTVAGNARGLLQAAAADRAPAVERARERRLYNSALDVGIRLIGPEGTASGGPQPDTSVPLPDSAPEPVTVRDGDTSWRAMSVRVKGLRKGVDGTLWLFSPDTTSEAQLGLVRTRVLTVAGLTAPLAGLLAGAVATRASRPLRRLQQRTSGLDPRATTTRLDHSPTRVTEVDDLARTLQTVLSRYDEQAARTAEGLATARSFSAAASHELRTPLMSMQTNLEILAEHPHLAEAERAQVVADLRREHARLLGLLVMLRELGRGDLVENDAFGPVDLAELADASVADLRRRHPEPRIAVSGEAGLYVHGWEPGLRTVLDNLLANAVVHGRRGAEPARVEVLLRTDGRQDGAEVVLTVDDEGPGIPTPSRETVFERFHRGAGSPGSGLGLTLVAQQVALHGGRVRVLDRPGGSGTRFEVRLPVRHGAPDAELTLPLRRDWMIETAAHPRESRQSHPRGSWQSPQSFHKDGS
ncbi:HAMP domain-containing histidine kinase [Streptomyces sp. A3M-1-3]|uniref:sensor histidine kinase n=1 Tax=Streptomyces sp. A3M-1-3 TaxID=2962044 RepID=UPI0020B6C307|nr:HAMP domain-containing sensor histidine kinase [Streptomyces sp. A3M-1-3]MCP3822208.1 HAMP domain-containing histidine kinase [Streptomyces sp. A3M-1-3]